MITRAWRLLTIGGRRVVLCLICDGYSANPSDIAQRYCGWCHVFLDALPEDYRRLKHEEEA